MATSALPFRVDPQQIERAERSELLQILNHYRNLTDEQLRRLIIQHNRIDILATEVLGYEIQPFHLAMLQFQFRHRTSLQLVFRGAGKTTVCTITKAIHYLCRNRNFRILLASKTTGNAEAFLKEIKSHLEQNEKLERLFGVFYDPKRVTKWDNREIEVMGRTRRTKEATITCAGVEGTIVSKHYDAILSDDLVDEENTRTNYMRDRTKTWYYKTLDPCLEPPDEKVEHRGEHHILGTRYHYDDLYGHLIDNELKDHHQVISALDEHDRSPWPGKYPPEWFKDKREKHGIIIFNSQYQCDVEAMKGEIFEYDDCQQIDQEELPAKLDIFMGIDLSITEEQRKRNDKFAILVIGALLALKLKLYYVLDHFNGYLKFSRQTDMILEFVDRWDPSRVGIETNAYQAAQYQTLKETPKGKETNIVPIHTDLDKVTRAWRLQPLFQNKQFFFLKSQTPVIDQLVGFPGHRWDDLFDGLDLAVRATKRYGRRRRGREKEPGVM